MLSASVIDETGTYDVLEVVALDGNKLRVRSPYRFEIGEELQLPNIERRGKEPVVNSTQIRYAFTNRFRFRSDKAARELGYRPGPLEPALRDAIDWFRAHHML